jgi:hypothetical protein
MEKRLPSRHITGRKASYNTRPLDSLEEIIEHREPLNWAETQRVGQLRQLHEDTVNTFIEQQGFGVMRMPRMSEWILKAGLREDPPLAQAAREASAPWSAADLEGPALPKDFVELEKDLGGVLRISIADFANPKGFGYVKDRRHVAGFQPPQFSQRPTPAAPWRLQTVELIGLLVREEPVAYISKHLPRMDELVSAPTRPLDEFEAIGLFTLDTGEDLFVRKGTDCLHVLGAIRSVKQCLPCHGGERGQLLGAFSYTLKRNSR